MPVLSDRWIIQQCTKPTHRFHDKRSDTVSRLITPPYSEYQSQVINERGFFGKYRNRTHREYAVPLKEKELKDWKPMIEGFCERPVRYVDKVTGEPVFLNKGEQVPETVRRIISYGVSSFGYDVRLKADPDQIKVFTNIFAPEIDPKNITETNFATPTIKTDEHGAKYVLIPAHSYIQAPTMEYFRIPRDVLVVVLGKSTYARAALVCNVTPIEPDFEGEVVVEIANVCNSPVRCYLEEGIAQFVFLQGNEACLTSYKDKLGKYQGQTGLTYARV